MDSRKKGGYHPPCRLGGPSRRHCTFFFALANGIRRRNYWLSILDIVPNVGSVLKLLQMLQSTVVTSVGAVQRKSDSAG